MIFVRGLVKGLVIIVINIIIMLGMIYIYDRFYVQRIVTIDMKVFIDKQRELFVTGKITEQQLNENLDGIRKFLEGIPNNEVVVLKEFVLKNGEDKKLPF